MHHDHKRAALGIGSAIVSLTALCLTACGTPSDADQIHYLVDRFDNAWATRDAVSACKLLTFEAQQAAIATAEALKARAFPDCVRAVEATTKDQHFEEIGASPQFDPRRATISNLQITGDSATARWGAEDAGIGGTLVNFQKVAGSWKLASPLGL